MSITFAAKSNGFPGLVLPLTAYVTSVASPNSLACSVFVNNCLNRIFWSNPFNIYHTIVLVSDP